MAHRAGLLSSRGAYLATDCPRWAARRS